MGMQLEGSKEDIRGCIRIRRRLDLAFRRQQHGDDTPPRESEEPVDHPSDPASPVLNSVSNPRGISQAPNRSWRIS